ncbi:MAG: hypothetical protein QM817_13080 [Archangium sp.]
MTITRAASRPSIPVTSSQQPLAYAPSGTEQAQSPQTPATKRQADTFEAGPVRVAQADTKKTKREELIDHITRGNDPAIDAALRKKIESALKAVSDKELAQLDKTGFRIFVGREVPPDLKDAGLVGPKLKSPAHYTPGIKVMLLNPDKAPTTSQIMHEVGHAKDDMMNDPKGLKPLAEYEGDKRTEMLEKSMPLASETDSKIKAAYQAYSDRFGSFPKDEHFHTPTQSDSYARSDASEFYAEAFATFHGGSEEMQARLLDQAPEIYKLLEADAKKQGLPVPDRTALKGKTNYTGLPNE